MDTTRFKLANAPLVLALAQVVTSAVLKIDEFIPDIQEQLRKSGYPIFRPDQTQQFSFNPGINPQITLASTPQWTFLSKDSREAVVVNPNSIVFQTTTYDKFDVFVERLKNILSDISDITEVALYERLGLRFVNLIRKNPSENFEEYLNSGLLGLSSRELQFDDILGRSHQMTGNTKMGVLNVKLLQTKDGIFLTPDLDPGHLNFPQKLSPGEEVSILDFDHIHLLTEPQNFVADEISKKMYELHQHIEFAFRKAVTEEALTKWGYTEVPAN
ncbi:MAG: TIGR04255 family protein [Trueperaceae bacterium]